MPSIDKTWYIEYLITRVIYFNHDRYDYIAQTAAGVWLAFELRPSFDIDWYVYDGYIESENRIGRIKYLSGGSCILPWWTTLINVKDFAKMVEQNHPEIFEKHKSILANYLRIGE